MKYRKRIEVIDAVQWSASVPHPDVKRDEAGHYLEIATVLGKGAELVPGMPRRIYLKAGDYIVSGADHGVFRMDAREFERNYEEVS